MLTPEQIQDGWIEHDGGPNPLPLDTMPGIMFGKGQQVEPGKYRAGYWLVGFWTGHFGPRDKIIAYKPENNHD